MENELVNEIQELQKVKEVLESSNLDSVFKGRVKQLIRKEQEYIEQELMCL